MSTRTVTQFSQILNSKVLGANDHITNLKEKQFQSQSSSQSVLSDSLLSIYSILTQSHQLPIASLKNSKGESKAKRHSPHNTFDYSVNPIQFPSVDTIKQSLEQYILIVTTEQQQINIPSNSNDSSRSLNKLQDEALDDLQWSIVGISALSVYSHLVDAFRNQTLPLANDINYWNSILNSSHNTLCTILYAIQSSPNALYQHLKKFLFKIFHHTKSIGTSSNSTNPIVYALSLTTNDLANVFNKTLDKIADIIGAWINASYEAINQAQIVSQKLFNLTLNPSDKEDLKRSIKSQSNETTITSSPIDVPSPSISSSLMVFLILYSPLNATRREIVAHKSQVSHLRLQTAKSLGYLVGESFRLFQTHPESHQQKKISSAAASHNSVILGDNQKNDWKLEIQIAVNTLAKVLQIPQDDYEEGKDSTIESISENENDIYDSSSESSSNESDSDEEKPIHVARKHSAQHQQLQPISTFSHFEASEDISTIRSSNSPVPLSSSVAVAIKILNIIESDLVYHSKRYNKVTHSHGQPSWLTRHWLGLTVFSFASVSLSKTIIGSWENIQYWFQHSVVDTAIAFYRNWIVGPLSQIYNIIRHDEHDAEIALITKRSLKADVESLERMVIQFAMDHGEIPVDAVSSTAGNASVAEASNEVVEALVKEIRQGDISSVLKPYETQIQTPIKSLITGDLIRSLLIQIQKTKVDIETAVSGIDRLLQSQQLVFGVVAAMPSFAFTYWAVITPGLNWIRGNARKSREYVQKKRELATILGRIDRLLSLLELEENSLALEPLSSTSSPSSTGEEEEEEEKKSSNSALKVSKRHGKKHGRKGKGKSSFSISSPSSSSFSKDDGDDYYTLLGLFLCETFLLRHRGLEMLPKSRIHDWNQYIGDLEDIQRGVHFQQKVVTRIWNVFSEYFK